MRRKNTTHQQDIDDLKKQNALLEQQGERGILVGDWAEGPGPGQQSVYTCTCWKVKSPRCYLLAVILGRPVARDAVRALEKAKGNNQLQANSYSSDSSLYTNRKGSAVSAFDGGSDSSSESEPEEPPTRKKLRVEPS